MRIRLIGVLATLALLLGALPMTATAAAPDIARISATSYLDLGGNGSPDLCGDGAIELYLSVSYSGVGPSLGGSGTGYLDVAFDLRGEDFGGEVEVDGKTMYIEGAVDIVCLGSNYGFIYGEFSAYDVASREERELICGSLSGTIQDGFHRNQGRVSMTLTSSGECLF